MLGERYAQGWLDYRQGNVLCLSEEKHNVYVWLHTTQIYWAIYFGQHKPLAARRIWSGLRSQLS